MSSLVRFRRKSNGAWAFPFWHGKCPDWTHDVRDALQAPPEYLARVAMARGCKVEELEVVRDQDARQATGQD